MINILLNGCNGKMGQVITRLSGEYDDICIIAGIDRNPSKLRNPYPVFSSIMNFTDKANVVVDFSIPEALPEIVRYCLLHRTALVVGTTGLSDEHHEMLRQASENIPIFVSSNMTFGISVMLELVLKAAYTLGEGYDIEILEKHHNEKRDAPSGTAMMLAKELKKQVSSSYEFVYDRSGQKEKRKHNEIGLLSMRGGTIAGEHTVYFAGKDEILEIKHTAISRDVLGRGAIKAIRYIVSKTNGCHDMKSILKELI